MKYRTAVSTPLVFATLLIGHLVPHEARAQSVDDIVDQAIAAYAEQTEGVENFTIVQHQEGREDAPQVIYFERVAGEEGPFFNSRIVGQAGQTQMSGNANPFDFFDIMREKGTYAGTATVRGRETHQVRMVDVGEAFADMAQAQGGSVTLTYHLDADSYRMRRMVVDTEVPGQPNASSRFVMDFLDYEETDGLTYPRRMEMDVDSPMMEGMAQQMQAMQQQMANLPEEQRERIRSMMEERMGPGMLGGTFIVTEVRVNAGPPSGLGGGG